MPNEKMVTVTVNGFPVTVPVGSESIHAIEQAGFTVPMGCRVEGLPPLGRCRLCTIDVGKRDPVCACETKVTDGMAIKTDTAAIHTGRKQTMRGILSDHLAENDCTLCQKHGKCGLLDLARRCGMAEEEIPHKKRKTVARKLDRSTGAIRFDPTSCIKCGKCVQVCSEIQKIGVFGVFGRGNNLTVGPPPGMTMHEAGCIACGQCTLECPVAGVTGDTHRPEIFKAFADRSKTVVIQIAPAFRVALGEMFGMGTQEVTGKINTALRLLAGQFGNTNIVIGDTLPFADLVAAGEAFELIERIKHGGKLPIFTSCCPAWVRYVELHASDLIPHLSTMVSPMQAFGAAVKMWWASKMGLDPKDVVVMFAGPCTAKKQEARRPELHGMVDFAFTTRGLAAALHHRGIDLARLPETPTDAPFAIHSGAAPIFGFQCGVGTAAFRAAAHFLGEKVLPQPVFVPVPGMPGVMEATIVLCGTAYHVAAVSGIGNVGPVLEQVRNGTTKYAAIEVMTCPGKVDPLTNEYKRGGCINGGGQPQPDERRTLERRHELLRHSDAVRPVETRTSNTVPLVEEIVKDLGGYESLAFQELFHTHYGLH